MQPIKFLTALNKLTENKEADIKNAHEDLPRVSLPPLHLLLYREGRYVFKLFEYINEGFVGPKSSSLPRSSVLSNSRRDAFLAVAHVSARWKTACTIWAALIRALAAGAKGLAACSTAARTAVAFWIPQFFAAGIHAASLIWSEASVLTAPAFCNVRSARPSSAAHGWVVALLLAIVVAVVPVWRVEAIRFYLLVCS